MTAPVQHNMRRLHSDDLLGAPPARASARPLIAVDYRSNVKLCQIFAATVSYKWFY